jgi:hypothetical protein
MTSWLDTPLSNVENYDWCCPLCQVVTRLFFRKTIAWKGSREAVIMPDRRGQPLSH